MANFLLALNISIDSAIGEPGHWKYFVDGLNARDKKYLREQMKGLSKILTTICEGLDMINSASKNQHLVFHNNAKTYY